MSSSPDLTEILTFAIGLARQAGAKIKHGSQTRFEAKTGVDEKKNSVDVGPISSASSSSSSPLSRSDATSAGPLFF